MYAPEMRHLRLGSSPIAEYIQALFYGVT